MPGANFLTETFLRTTAIFPENLSCPPAPHYFGKITQAGAVTVDAATERKKTNLAKCRFGSQFWTLFPNLNFKSA